MLPMRREILRGLLGADLLGFHVYEYARHFLHACTHLLGSEVRPLHAHCMPTACPLHAHCVLMSVPASLASSRHLSVSLSISTNFDLCLRSHSVRATWRGTVRWMPPKAAWCGSWCA